MGSILTASDLLEFKLDGLPDIRDDLDSGNMVVSAAKVKRLLSAFDYVEQLHRSDPPATVYTQITPGSAVYRKAHGANDNG
jgi:hypothetical protein